MAFSDTRHGAADTFIPVAEEYNLIMPLGEWALREACREAASWPRPLTIAVNVSPIQFHHGDLPSLVHTILLETGLAPARLELEITEGVLINDFSRALSILRRLKALASRSHWTILERIFLAVVSALISIRQDQNRSRLYFRSRAQPPLHRDRARGYRAGHSLEIPILAEGVETDPSGPSLFGRMRRNSGLS